MEEKALYEMSSFPSPMIQYLAGALKMEKAKSKEERKTAGALLKRARNLGFLF